MSNAVNNPHFRYHALVQAGFGAFFFPLERIFKMSPGSYPASNSQPDCFNGSSNLLVLFLFVISVHFRYLSSEHGTGQICYKFFLTERILRCRRGPTRRAIVHRTIAFRSSNLSGLDFSKKKKHTIWCAFSFWRYRPDLNWRITVLQTGALPLGYGTV